MWKIYKYVIVISIIVALASNFILSVIQKDFWGIVALRNIYLLLFLICFIICKKWTLVLLLIFNLTYWYLYITFPPQAAYYNNPILNYYDGFSYLFLKGKLLLIIPFITNVLITIYDIPIRIYKLKNTEII